MKNNEIDKARPSDNACEHIEAALGLSLANSFGPLATRDSDALRGRLFVTSGGTKDISSEPYVIATEVFQAVVSFLLLFLFALALRRQFRVV